MGGSLRLSRLLCVLLAGMAGTVAGQDSDQACPVSHKLPDDPAAVVIMLDRPSFFTQRLENKEALLVIRADGTARVSAYGAKWQRLEANISPARIQELLEFAIGQNHFFEFDPNRVQEEVQGRGTLPRDLWTTKIRIHADGQDKTVSWYALSISAERYKVEALLQLHAIERELARLRIEIYAGGREQITQHLEIANAKLAADHPDVPALSVNDLSWAARYIDETSAVTFKREETLAGSRLRYTRIEIKYAPDTEPIVKVQVSVREQ